MQIDFKALEQALAPIEQIGQGELTFDAGPTTITLRVLLPAEEVEAQKYAATALNEGDEGEHNAVDYLDRLRLGILSHSVIAVGDTSFRGVEFVETGERLGNGAAVKIPRYKAMRQLLSRWTRSTMTACFAKFHELSLKADEAAEKAIVYEPANIPTEIDRLQSRIAELKAAQEQQEATEKATFTDKVASLAQGNLPESGILAEPQRRTEVEMPDRDEDGNPLDAEQAMSPVHRRGPISPTIAPPPTAPAPAPTAPQSTRAYLSPADSSFIDMEDDASMNAALDAEHHRLLAMRRGNRTNPDGSALATIHPQMQQTVRRPPHMEALEAEEEVGVLVAAHAKAEEVGTLDGKPVFKMPSQELGTRASQGPARTVLNPQMEAGGSKNPRFTAPKKP